MKRLSGIITIMCFILVGCSSINADYKEAVNAFQSENYELALQKFSEIEDYQDSQNYIEKCYQALFEDALSNNNYVMAKKYKKNIENPSQEMLKKYEYLQWVDKYNNYDKESAVYALLKNPQYEDSMTYIREYVKNLLDQKQYKKALKILEKCESDDTCREYSNTAKLMLRYSQLTNKFSNKNYIWYADPEKVDLDIKLFYDKWICEYNKDVSFKITENKIGKHKYWLVGFGKSKDENEYIMVYKYKKHKSKMYAMHLSSNFSGYDNIYTISSFSNMKECSETDPYINSVLYNNVEPEVISDIYKEQLNIGDNNSYNEQQQEDYDEDDYSNEDSSSDIQQIAESSEAIAFAESCIPAAISNNNIYRNKGPYTDTEYVSVSTYGSRMEYYFKVYFVEHHSRETIKVKIFYNEFSNTLELVE